MLLVKTIYIAYSQVAISVSHSLSRSQWIENGIFHLGMVPFCSIKRDRGLGLITTDKGGMT